LILKLLDGFGIILNTLVVGQRDSKELIKEIVEGTVALRFIVLFKSLVGSIIVDYSINYLLGVIIGSSSYGVYSKLIFLLPFS
jgi:hypothetical protein